MLKKFLPLLLGAQILLVPAQAHAEAVQANPAIQPNVAPQVAPAIQPTVAPQVAPTVQPTVAPQAAPAVQPTIMPVTPMPRPVWILAA